MREVDGDPAGNLMLRVGLQRIRANGSACYLTPREVERRYPPLTRKELTLRRAHGLAPEFEIISGCVMYPTREIEAFIAFLATGTASNNGYLSLFKACRAT